MLRHDSALPSVEKRIAADSSLQKARVPEVGSAGTAVTLNRDEGVPLHPLSANTYPIFLPLARRGSINMAWCSDTPLPLPIPPRSDSVQVNPCVGKLAA